MQIIYWARDIIEVYKNELTPAIICHFVSAIIVTDEAKLKMMVTTKA